MRKVIRNIAIVVSILTISLILSASGGNQNGIGGGKGANGSGGKNAWVGNKPQYVMDSCGSMNCTIYLPLSLDVNSIPGRTCDYFNPMSNILNGLQNVSAPSLEYQFDNLNYCLVTVSAPDCIDYGTKTFRWHNDIDGIVSMTIDIPECHTFSLKIEIYESCVSCYENGSWGRACFVHEHIYEPSLQILLDERDFVNLTVMSCIT